MLEKLLTEAAKISSMEILAFIKAMVLILISFGIYKLFIRMFNKIAEAGFIHEQLRLTLDFIVRWLIISITILLVMGMFGFSVKNLWTAFSAVLVLFAIGFVAVWSVLSNMFCSVLLVIFSPFRIGDEIEIQDATADIRVSGKVRGINLMHTTLISEQDGHEEIIRVPNNFFFHKYIRRFPGERTKSLKTYMAEQHEHAVAESNGEDEKKQ